MSDDLPGDVRRILDANRYWVLGTTEPDGSSRVSPVWFTHVDARALYWVSSPDARHSRNLAERPRFSGVVFDSSHPPDATNEAVYLSGAAAEVPEAELAAECEVAFATAGGWRGGRAFAPSELSGDGDLRLYRARPDTYALHLRGRDPRNEKGIDTRLPVEMP
jgi:hypothetical protein